MFKLLIPRRIQKRIKLLKQSYQIAIISNLQEIQDYPFVGKPLTRELAGRRALRIGVYRIIYSINAKDKTVKILDFGHRTTIYNK